MSDLDSDLHQLHFAVLEGDKIQVLKLLEYGADIDSRDDNDCTGLYLAAQEGEEDIAQLLLCKGAAVDSRNSRGYTPLHITCENGFREVADHLIKHGADVNARESEWGSTPLIMGSYWGYPDVVSLLLNHKADPSISAYFDYSPLACASIQGHCPVVRTFLTYKKGVDIETKSSNGYTPLLHACSNAHLDIVEVLLSVGADIYAVDKQGVSACHIVAALGNLELLKILIKHLANIKAKDHKGNTPLHTAVTSAKINSVKFLIQGGCDPNVQDNKGYTALHSAAEKGNVEIVKYMQNIGADAKLKTTDGHTAIELAYFGEHMFVVEVLKLVSQLPDDIEDKKAVYRRSMYVRQISKGSGRSSNGPVPAPRKRTASSNSSFNGDNTGSILSGDDTYSVHSNVAETQPVISRNDSLKHDSGYISAQSNRQSCTLPNMMKDPNVPESYYTKILETERTVPTLPRKGVPPPQTREQPPSLSGPNEYHSTTNTGSDPAAKHVDYNYSNDQVKPKGKIRGFFNRLKQKKQKPGEGNNGKGMGIGKMAVTDMNESAIHKDLQHLHINPRMKEILSRVYIDYHRLVLGDLLGRGNFGRVYLGNLKTNTGYDKIAVKTTKYRADEHEMIEVFIKEALLMKDFRHAHVLSLIGVTFDLEGNPLALLPFMNHGNLRAYIRDPQKPLSVHALLSLGLQVGRGMEYLSKNNFVHRDLACRNCMIDQEDDHCVVKVADFGLSRDLYAKDYYRISDRSIPLPVRWMALESMQSNIFKLKSDVWSYGVLVWELLTRGATPYSEIENWDIEKYLIRGRRLPKPKYCSDPIYALMQSCWNVDPSKRPTFSLIVTSIEDHMHSELCVSSQVNPADQLMAAKKMYYV